MATWTSDGSLTNAWTGSTGGVKTIHDRSETVDGDTITMPAGTFSDWTTLFTITKAIILQGLTDTTDESTTADDQTNIEAFNTTQSLIAVRAPVRITGITFVEGTSSGTHFGGMINVATDITEEVRIDHCHFVNLVHEGEWIACFGSTIGVIDHNLFTSTGSGFPITAKQGGWDGDSLGKGDESWAQGPFYGTNKFIFIEDNVFDSTSYRGICDSFDGGRMVIRYNHCYNMGFGTHGTEPGRDRGMRCVEIYANDFHFNTSGGNNVGGVRSGSMVCYDNTADGSFAASDLNLQQYRIFSPENDVFWGSTGANAWDYNVTESDGVTHIDGHAPYLFDSGTATGGSTTTMVDSGKSWTPNQWIGYVVQRTNIIINSQAGYYGLMLITSNTATTLTGIHDAIHLGVTWAAGNTYEIHKCLISMDQPGRGTGDLITGSGYSAVNSTTGTKAWTHQVLEPCYAWNNIQSPGDTDILIENGTGGFALFEEDRDYYNNTEMPGYTPYTYPHPLVSGEEPAVTYLHGANVLLAVRL